MFNFATRTEQVHLRLLPPRYRLDRIETCFGEVALDVVYVLNLVWIGHRDDIGRNSDKFAMFPMEGDRSPVRLSFVHIVESPELCVRCYSWAWDVA